MNKIHPFVLRISKWPVWLFFFLSLLAFAGYVMPKAQEGLAGACGRLAIPDTEVGYDAAWLRQTLQAMDGPCREAYRRSALLQDALFPVAYGFFLFFSVAVLFYKTRSPFVLRGLYLLPLAGMLCDYGENFTLAFLMDHPAAGAGFLPYIAAAFSALKWFFFYGSLLLLLAGAVRWLVLRFRQG